MEKIITKNWGAINPMDIGSFQRKGGYRTLWHVLREKMPVEVIEEIKKSGLQGRGGAGFPTGEKWQITASQAEKERYFIANIDESEPGNFKDRMIVENNPHQVIEGILIGAYATGARKGFIYLNGHFKMAENIFQKAIEQAYKNNLLGRNILGTAFDFDLELFVGAGAYICGEETALINSIEGKRGEPRNRPPFPCSCGLFSKPTVVNNAETLANISWIMKNGAEKFSKIGMKKSPGTKLFCIDGSVKKPGLYEAPIGTNIQELIFETAGGMKDGFEFLFTQVGGYSGTIVNQSLTDEMPNYDRKSKIPLGSGSIFVADKFTDVKKVLLSWIRFFQRESCGKCVPCREGTFRLKAIIERLNNGEFNQNDREDLEKILWTLENTTFCPLGKFATVGIRGIMKNKFIKELNK